MTALHLHAIIVGLLETTSAAITGCNLSKPTQLRTIVFPPRLFDSHKNPFPQHRTSPGIPYRPYHAYNISWAQGGLGLPGRGTINKMYQKSLDGTLPCWIALLHGILELNLQLLHQQHGYLRPHCNKLRKRICPGRECSGESRTYTHTHRLVICIAILE